MLVLVVVVVVAAAAAAAAAAVGTRGRILGLIGIAGVLPGVPALMSEQSVMPDSEPWVPKPGHEQTIGALVILTGFWCMSCWSDNS